MTWVIQCTDDNTRLMAENKDQLAEKLMDHMKEMHDMQMTRDQAMMEVNKMAKQAA